MTVNILGTKYTVTKKKYSEDPAFAKSGIDGYCKFQLHQIVHCDMSTYPDWEDESPESIHNTEQQTLRHEIVHAFFHESGLSYNANTVDGSWAVNEEMVDWIALQGPKVYEAWRQADAL